MNKVGVMEGSLREFALAEVLSVVGLGRQYTGIELRLPGDQVGTIFVKSGQVVSARSGSREGRDAFLELVPAEHGQFFVFRADTPPQLPEPLGPLGRLLLDAEEARAVSERTSAQRAEPSASASSGTIPRVPLGAEAPQATKVALLGEAPPPRTADTKVAPRILGVVSPKGGSGKSTIALNLALSLARRGHTVVLVDGDVNGDVLSAINARARAKLGALDVVSGRARLDDALIETVQPRLKLMPAAGDELPDPEQLALDPKGAWRSLLAELAGRCDVVVVDTPSGMFGPTRPILRALTHVLGVLQSESIAARSFVRFKEGLASLADEERPSVVGVVLNMLQTRHHASLAVFQEALEGLPNAWMFDTTIPRHPAFLDATHQGLPLRHLDEDAPPPVAFLFDNLAGEVAERLGLQQREARARPFLL